MNLQEEINKSLLPAEAIRFTDLVLTKDDAKRIAEDYAEQKAWQAWKQVLYNLFGTQPDVIVEANFNEWWSKNK